MNIHRRNGLVIHTSFDYPPIPIRDWDWSACLDDYDGAEDAGYQPVGYGRTEDEAIACLIEFVEELAEEERDIARAENRDEP